ncbi:MAG: hypothetical protein BM485_05835 [Desulfobulbaceae bacterium DB1]|nr:MAG: hypothetical protein BM485_05835 [Desulfobulbaceae bacterium DB1]
MGYFPRVFAGERAFFEQEMRDKGFPLFSISSRSGRLLQPAPASASHFPLLYYEPFEPTNAALIGYDLAGDTAFSGVVDKTVVKNEAVFVYDSLVSLPGSLWCFKAVYAGKNVPEAPEARRNAACGVIALRI